MIVFKEYLSVSFHVKFKGVVALFLRFVEFGRSCNLKEKKEFMGMQDTPP